MPKRITDVAAGTVVSWDALHSYENLGIVAPVRRTSVGCRLYDDGIVDTVAGQTEVVG